MKLQPQAMLPRRTGGGESIATDSGSQNHRKVAGEQAEATVPTNCAKDATIVTPPLSSIPSSGIEGLCCAC